MINVLDNWMSESTQNFNIIVGVTPILFLVSLIILFVISKKIGKPDERTNAIYFKISSFMFITQIIMNSIFISSVDRDIQNFRQFFILFEGLVFFVGAIYSIGLYRKEVR